MADVRSPTLNQQTYNGTHGNLSLATATYTAAGVASGDKIRIMNLPVGTSIHGYRVHNVNLGSGVSMQLAIRQADGTETNLGSSLSGTSTTPKQGIVSPVYIGQEGPSELLVVISGGTATGAITTQLELVATGY